MNKNTNPCQITKRFISEISKSLNRQHHVSTSHLVPFKDKINITIHWHNDNYKYSQIYNITDSVDKFIKKMILHGVKLEKAFRKSNISRMPLRNKIADMSKNMRI